MAKYIEILIDTKQFHKSNLVLIGIDKLTIQYDRYNPTHGGSYLELPQWIAKKKHVLVLKTEIISVFKSSVQCCVLGINYQVHPEREYHYTKIKDNIIDWHIMKYPAGNNDIDRFEEANKGLISVNVYAELKYFDTASVVLHKRTKTVTAEHQLKMTVGYLIA